MRPPESREAARLIASSGVPAPEARTLLALALDVPREALVAQPERIVPAEAAGRFRTLCARRLAGEPIAYLVGQREFFGRAFRVDPSVLIPRPETECLVEAALQWLQDKAAPNVLDLGTGSGCIAITVALQRPDAQVFACDFSAAALERARANAAALGACVEFRAGDWYDAVRPRRFDLIVSNPPYIAAGDPHLADLSFEPPVALTDGGNGLSCLRAVIAQGHAHLNPGGALMVEHGYDQGAAVRDLMEKAGFKDARTQLDLAGLERICIGRMPGG